MSDTSEQHHPVRFTKLAWWMILARGVVAIAFGILLLTDPVDTLRAFIWVYGIFVIVDGAVAIAYGMGIFGRTNHRGLVIARGLLAIAAGVVAVAWPGLTALAVLVLIGIWALVVGVVEIGEAFSLRDAHYRRWYLALVSGVAYVLLGILIFASPESSALALTWLIGVFTIAAGITILFASIHTRGEFSYRRGAPTRLADR